MISNHFDTKWIYLSVQSWPNFHWFLINVLSNACQKYQSKIWSCLRSSPHHHLFLTPTITVRVKWEIKIWVILPTNSLEASSHQLECFCQRKSIRTICVHSTKLPHIEFLQKQNIYPCWVVENTKKPVFVCVDELDNRRWYLKLRSWSRTILNIVVTIWVSWFWASSLRLSSKDHLQ